MRYQLRCGLSSMRTIFAAAFVAGCWACSTNQCRIPPRVLADVEKQSGLEFEHPVECRRGTRPQVQEYLRQSVLVQSSEGEIRAEGRAFELLGLVPVGYDYYSEVIDLYSQRLLAFYSAELGFFVLGDDGDAEAEREVVMHELVHALQDQHYDARAILDRTKYSSDVLLARTAVLEADAGEVTNRAEGRLSCDPKTENEIIDRLEFQLRRNPEAKVPKALDLLISFPYLYGERFVCRLEHGAHHASAAEIFRALPVSTREIIRPAEYEQRRQNGGGEAPRGREAPWVRAHLAGASIVYSDAGGAATALAFLSTYLSVRNSAAAVQELSRDEIALVRLGAEERNIAVWHLEFDSDAASKRFFGALRDAYQRRFGSLGRVEDGKLCFVGGGVVSCASEGPKETTIVSGFGRELSEVRDILRGLNDGRRD